MYLTETVYKYVVKIERNMQEEYIRVVKASITMNIIPVNRLGTSIRA